MLKWLKLTTTAGVTIMLTLFQPGRSNVLTTFELGIAMSLQINNVLSALSLHHENLEILSRGTEN